jgi:hypothetical protein
MNRINWPDLDAQALQRENRCTVSDVPVNDAGLDGQNVQEKGIVLVLELKGVGEWSDGLSDYWDDEAVTFYFR